MLTLNRVLGSGVVLAVLSGCSEVVSEEAWRVESPGGKLVLEVGLRRNGSAGASLHYRIRLLGEGEPTPALDWSPLGVRRSDQDFTEGLSFRRVSSVETVAEDYELSHGKQRHVNSRSRRITLGLVGSGGGELEVEFRVFDGGVGFRYRFPGHSSELLTVSAETTGFRLPEGSLGYLQPHDAPGRYTPAYETLHQRDVPLGTPAPTEEGWSFPALFRLPGDAGWVLLTESDLSSAYCGSRLAGNATGGLYRLRFPSAGEGRFVGAVEPSHTLPWTTPWRIVMASRTLAGIVESTLVTDLSRPGSPIPAWVRPGRVGWSWWIDPESPKHFDRQLPFVDFSAEMGWEYVLLDANWDEMGEDALRRLADHARQRGVRLLLWYNSGGPHNDVTEKPRDRMFEREARRREMQWMQELGIAGIKVDFFQSDKQDTVRLYEDILRDAADYGLMVNFHGCTLPRGWERTYPHLMSMEAVKATESYIFDPDFPERAARHQTLLPFTRNVVGPMDYTPVALSDNRYPRRTTAGHELALAVLFTTGWLHFADSPETYRALPEGPREFLRDVPVVWDETRFLAGEPGRFVVLARRHGETWYVAGINGEDFGLPLTFELSFLAEGEIFRGRLITDGADRNQFRRQDLAARSGDRMALDLPPRGGLVMVLERAEG